MWKMVRVLSSRPQEHLDIVRINGLPTLRACQYRIKDLLARPVLMEDGTPLLTDKMDIAPMDQRYDDRVQGQPLRRKAVLVTKRALLVCDLRQDKIGHEPLQPVSQNAPGNAEAALELLKLTHPQEAVPQD
ncbi:hypothetical protein D3C84_924230 [compost metagenome]